MNVLRVIAAGWVGLALALALVWTEAAQGFRRAPASGRRRRALRPQAAALPTSVIKVVGHLAESDALAVRSTAAEVACRTGLPAVIDLSCLSYFDGTALSLLTTPGMGPAPRLIGLEQAVQRLTGVVDLTERSPLQAWLTAEPRASVLTPFRTGSHGPGHLDLHQAVVQMLDGGGGGGGGGDLLIDLSWCPSLEPSEALEIADLTQWWTSLTGRAVALRGVGHATRETLRLAGMPAGVPVA